MKKIVVIIFCVLLVGCFSGCGGLAKPLSEDELKQNLPSEVISKQIDGTEEAFTVKSFSIDKRQTNEEEKNDIVYCNVELENQDYIFTEYWKITCNYYDEGGWIVDDALLEQRHYTVINNPFSDDRALIDFKDYFHGRFDTCESIYVDSHNMDSANNIITYTILVNDEFTNCTDSGVGIVRYEFDGYEWSSYVELSPMVRQWNLIGQWGFLDRTGPFTSTDNCQIILDITNFNQENLQMEGTAYFSWQSTYPDKFYEEQYDLANAKISIQDWAVWISWAGTDTGVRFEKDSAVGYEEWYWCFPIIRN